MCWQLLFYDASNLGMTAGIDVQFVRDYYQKMTDEEIIRVAKHEVGNLTEEAQEVVKEEVKRRNLDTNATNFLEEEQTQNQYTLISKNNNKSFEFALLFTGHKTLA